MRSRAIIAAPMRVTLILTFMIPSSWSPTWKTACSAVLTAHKGGTIRLRRPRVDILGTKGLITIGGLQNGTTLCFTQANGMAGDAVKSWTNLFADAYIAEDISFVNCILNHTDPEVSGLDGMMAVAVVRAGNQSIQTGENHNASKGESECWPLSYSARGDFRVV